LTEPDIAALEEVHGVELVPRVGAASAADHWPHRLSAGQKWREHVLDHKPDARTNKRSRSWRSMHWR